MYCTYHPTVEDFSSLYTVYSLLYQPEYYEIDLSPAPAARKAIWAIGINSTIRGYVGVQQVTAVEQAVPSVS